MAYLNPLSVKRTAIRTKQLGNERGGGGGAVVKSAVLKATYYASVWGSRGIRMAAC